MLWLMIAAIGGFTLGFFVAHWAMRGKLDDEIRTALERLGFRYVRSGDHVLVTKA